MKPRTHVLWVWSNDHWTAVLSSKTEQTMRDEETACREAGMKVIVLLKGHRP